MKSRGRQSAAASAVVITGAFGKRPDPPAELTKRQKQIWRSITASEEIYFFSTGALRLLLADFCRHREQAEVISAYIDEIGPTQWRENAESLQRHRLLLQMRDLEVRAALTIATKLRLTNQARYTPQGAAGAARRTAKASGRRPEKTGRPWEE